MKGEPAAGFTVQAPMIMSPTSPQAHAANQSMSSPVASPVGVRFRCLNPGSRRLPAPPEWATVNAGVV